MSRARVFGAMIVACGSGLVAGCASGQESVDRAETLNRTRVVSWDDAAVHQGDWGEMRFYFRGQTPGTRDVLTAMAVVQPGKAVHRAHRHAEEEYLLINEGSGVWSVDGQEMPARKGDCLYVEPWVFHGLTNTGEIPLVFTVVRYNPKGVPIPPRPDDEADER